MKKKKNVCSLDVLHVWLLLMVVLPNLNRFNYTELYTSHMVLNASTYNILYVCLTGFQ